MHNKDKKSTHLMVASIKKKSFLIIKSTAAMRNVRAFCVRAQRQH